MPREHAGSSSAWVLPWNAEGLSNESVKRSVELASMTAGGTALRQDPQDVRADLRESRRAHVRRRRAIAALSLVGMASMAAVSLFQLGILRRRES